MEAYRGWEGVEGGGGDGERFSWWSLGVSTWVDGGSSIRWRILGKVCLQEHHWVPLVHMTRTLEAHGYLAAVLIYVCRLYTIEELVSRGKAVAEVRERKKNLEPSSRICP